MPVEFLSDAEAAAYGRYTETPGPADLERVFFLDDEDLALVGRHRGEHMRFGFALQMVTVRWLGTFLEDPVDVPGAVLDFVAEQLEVADPSQIKRYTERTKTRFDHQWEIRRALGMKEFTDVEAQFAQWGTARSWTSGDGPKAIFYDGVSWLRERKVLLPGVTTLARLVAKVRDDTNQRLWNELEGLLASMRAWYHVLSTLIRGSEISYGRPTCLQQAGQSDRRALSCRVGDASPLKPLRLGGGKANGGTLHPLSQMAMLKVL